MGAGVVALEPILMLILLIDYNEKETSDGGLAGGVA